MRYCNNPQADIPIFLIDAMIGRPSEDEAGQDWIDAREFVRELLEVDAMGKSSIMIWINSPGGRVMDGELIYSVMLKTKTKVDTTIVGIAHSIAGVIFQAGRKRIMMDYATQMCHNVSDPSAKDGDPESELVKAVNISVSKMIAGRSGRTAEEVIKLMEAETYMDADYSLSNGFCDTIEKVSDLNKPRLTQKADVLVNFATSKKYIESKFQNLINKTKTMTKVNSLLNLNVEASEEATASAVSALIADKENSTKTIADLTNKVKVAEDKLRVMEAEKVEREKVEAEAKKVSDLQNKETFEAKAKTEVEAKIKERGVTLDATGIEKFVNLAKTDEATLKSTIETIEAIPVVKKAALFQTLENKGGSKGLLAQGADGGVTSTNDYVLTKNAELRNKNKH